MTIYHRLKPKISVKVRFADEVAMRLLRHLCYKMWARQIFRGDLMKREEIIDAYREYIACLNAQDWGKLQRLVMDNVEYNGKAIGLDGYRDMLVADFRTIPDLSFNIAFLVCDPPIIASRLAFDCTPVGELFGLAVNGKRVRFGENVFYEYREGKIQTVWSVIDKSSIAAQI